MAPPPPPSLMDDLIGEILLRLPPGDPACLVRASLVCKIWRGLLSDRGFLRRYRAFHRTPPPVLGFFHDDRDGGRFVPVTGEPSSIPHPELDWCPLDCHHGRVLFNTLETPGLVVWDPITGGRQHLRQPRNQLDQEYEFFTAAVLCASDGCDHLECRGGPYLVVFAGTDIDYGHELDDDDEFCVVRASVYSSETGAWSKEVLADLGPIAGDCEVMGSSLLAGDMIYFILEEGQRILEYDLVRHVLSVINGPSLYAAGTSMVLMTAEDGGGLGIAHVNEDYLLLWSWKIGPWRIGYWKGGRVIKLGMMISIATGAPSASLDLVGFAEGAGSIFVRADDSVFILELKPDRVRKVGKRGDNLRIILPFTSFYTPDQFKIASANED